MERRTRSRRPKSPRPRARSKGNYLVAAAIARLKPSLLSRVSVYVQSSIGLIVVFHAASGAAVGSIARSRLVSAAVGPLLHIGADRIPHDHPRHARWEYVSGLLFMGWLIRRRGLFDPATVGAASTVMPDLEHLIPRSPRRNRKLFHARRRRNEPVRRRVSVRAQLLSTALLSLPVLVRRPPGARVASTAES